MQRVIHPLVGPDGRDRDDPVVHLTDRAKPLSGDMIGMRTRLAVTRVVDDQHTLSVWRRGRIVEQQRQAPGIDRSASQVDSDRKNCSRWTTAACAATTGSTPVSAVSVLLVAITRQEQALE